MAVPVYVQAGAGVAILTGTGTVEMTGATAGNLILIHFVVRGTAEDWSALGSVTNMEQLDGTDSDYETLVNGIDIGSPITSKQGVMVARAIADGTVSGTFTVGASGQDIFARMYEVSGESLGTTVAAVFENDAGTWGFGSIGTDTSVGDSEVITNGADRLALNFVGIDANRAIASFTGETGGNWTEAFPEYAPATGATATLQLQYASMPTAGTITGGTATITSAGWGVFSTAIIPAPSISGTGRRTFKRFFGPALLTAAAADLYTVPSAKRAIIRHIHVSNPTASPVDLTLSIGADAAGTRIYDDRPVSADGILQEYRDYTLAAGEKVQGFASTTGVLNLTIDGYEEAL